MIRLVPRAQPSRAMSLASPLVALALTVLVGVVLFAALGKDPLKALQVFFYEPVKNGYALAELSIKAVPLVLIALGLSVCYRSNVWNIGAEGQFLVGAIAAGGLAMWVTTADVALSRWAFFPLLVLAGAAGGAAWAAVRGPAPRSTRARTRSPSSSSTSTAGAPRESGPRSASEPPRGSA